MRYLYIYLTIFLLGCNDKGNYDYHDINEIVIDGITDQDLYDVIALKEDLVIRPDLKRISSEVNLNDLEFEWRLLKIGSKDEYDESVDYVISREKDLEYYVTEIPGIYYGSYTVIDKKSGNKFKKLFFVNIRSLTAEGWAILCEENNKSRLDWIFNVSDQRDELITNLWDGNDSNMGAPVSLKFLYGLNGSYRLVNGENGSFNLDPLLHKTNEAGNMKYLFYTIPDRVDVRGGSPQITYRSPSIFAIVDAHGDIYTRTLDPGAMFDYQSNIVTGETDYFTAAPYVAMNIWKGGSGGGSVIFYDQTNCRFVEYLNDALYPSVAKITGTLFQSTDNHEMIFMETTMTQSSFALLRNKTTGKYYIYGFKIGIAGNTTQSFYSEVKGPDLDKLTKVSFHNIYNYMFYATDSKVYRFEIQNDPAGIKEAEEVISLPGETIVEIMSPKFSAWEAYKPWETDRANRLVIASNKNNQSGNVRIYDVPSLSQPLVLYKNHVDMGIGKIVDIDYFEREKIR